MVVTSVAPSVGRFDSRFDGHVVPFGGLNFVVYCDGRYVGRFDEYVRQSFVWSLRQSFQ